ncbi:ABC transporter substrate-binding protein [Rhodococcus sp. X156]|uniref:peptide ABC transporter substrate-binding protein n=1 Tax=Rhodococcus sp. X156 TaxID=2499145 RepID=UPI000FDA24AB|nr:ABC transporter substrate-binding protein [Rhodococcus sp. X156]
MRVKRFAAAVALPVAAMMLIAGCGGSSSDSSGGSSDPNAAISIQGTQPENPLVPANTNEEGGSIPLDVMFTGLVSYDTDTSDLKMEIAESITTTDAQHYDIKLKDGYTFHDGTPVDAKSFVDAWNWAAYAPNAALNASFFEQVKGYQDVNPTPPAGSTDAPAPTAKTMSGLTVVSPTEIKVELVAPYSPFKQKLGYHVFAPLPQSFYADPVAFGRNPVGNGPFKFVAWNDNTDIKITRWDDYKGEKPQVKDVTIKLYQSSEAAYADLVSGNLDFQQLLPPSALAGEKYQSDLMDRTLDKDAPRLTTVSLPMYDQRFANADLRKAISMSINREQIAKVIFNDTYVPSTSFSSPAITGYEADTCGEACTYDPAKAKDLLAKAGGFSGPLTLTYNSDGGHKDWSEAVCNSIKSSIGIDCVATPTPTFSVLRQSINAKQMSGLFRSAWSYDFPNLENGLSPLYSTTGSANDSKYSNPEFDAALLKAAAISDPAESNKAFIEAEKMLAADLPAIPLWSVTQKAGYSERLSNAKLSYTLELDLTQVRVNS